MTDPARTGWIALTPVTAQVLHVAQQKADPAHDRTSGWRDCTDCNFTVTEEPA